MSDKKYDGHTPGPWEIKKDREPYTVIRMTKGKCSETEITPYASIGGFTAKKKHEMQANALLIADAPMLLKQRDEAVRALQEILSEIPDKPKLPLTWRIKEIAEQGVKEAG